MAAELIKLEPRIDPRQVIATLEELLQRAKDGEFEAFIAVCVRPDGGFCTRSSGCKNSIEMIGALWAAQFDLLKASEK